FAWDEFQKNYRTHLRELTESCFGDDGLTTKSIPQVRAAIRELAAADAEHAKKAADAAQAARGPGGFGPPGFGPPGFGPGPGRGSMFGSPEQLDVFMKKRRESVLAQLDGKSKGKQPGMQFPGGPPGGGRGFGPGNFLGPQMLTAADANKDEKISRDEFAGLA